MLSRVFRSAINDSRLLGILVPGAVVLATGSVVIGRAMIARRDAWLLGDWMIDYSAGFTRRGLIGEAIRQVAAALGIDRIVMTGVIIWLVFASVVFVVTALFLYQYRGFTTVLLLVSPAFLFFFLNVLGTMRKELLLFLLIGVVLLATKITRRGEWAWLLPVLFPVLVFAHEGLAFYGLFVLIIFFLLVSDGLLSQKQAMAQGSAMVFLTAFAGWVLIRLGDSAGIDQRICDNLVSEGYSTRLCGGAIAFLDRTTPEAIDRVAGLVATNNYLSTYAVAIALAAVPFIFVRFSRTALTLLSIAAIVTAPLFVVAIDWGRWIAISVWMVTMITVRFDGTRHIRLQRLNPKTLMIDLLAIVGIVLYATLWSLPHCCEPRIGFGLIDRFADVLTILGRG